MSIFDIILRVLLILATTSLFGIVFITYLKLKTTKILLFAVGFGFFVVYALLGVPEIFGQALHIDENVHLTLHLISLAFLLVGMFKNA